MKEVKTRDSLKKEEGWEERELGSYSSSISRRRMRRRRRRRPTRGS